MGNTNIFITYEELSKLQKDSADKASIVSILKTEFPDETCKLIAIKSILGMIEKEEENPIIPDIPVDNEPEIPDDEEEPTD